MRYCIQGGIHQEGYTRQYIPDTPGRRRVNTEGYSTPRRRHQEDTSVRKQQEGYTGRSTPGNKYRIHKDGDIRRDTKEDTPHQEGDTRMIHEIGNSIRDTQGGIHQEICIRYYR